MGTDSKEQWRRIFSARAEEWAAYYSDPDAPTLDAQSLLSRQGLALEMIEASVPPPAKVLDLGCGTGEMAAKLMERGYEVWGLDIAEPMVRYARDRCGSDRFRVGDIEHLPFRDETFDAIVCLGVIEYLDTDECALREMRRVLKPGGRAVISTPSATSLLHHMDSVALGLTAVARLLYHVVKYRTHGSKAAVAPPAVRTVHRRYYRGRWLRLLRSVGLEAEDWICHGWGWPRSHLGLVAHFLSRTGKVHRRYLEGLIGPAAFRRARARLFRGRAFSWVGAEQLVQVRALK
jgi:ubiquinone/menaquinone biosynthesis C-methylase UbiE